MRFISFILAGLLTLCFTESAYAARLLLFTIAAKEHVLVAMHTDNGLAKPAEVWSYLRTVSFQMEAKPSGEPGALQMKLQGPVVIRVTHADRTLAEAKLTELTLTRPHATSTEWSLPADEVVRTGEIAGFNASELVVQTQSWQWWARGISIFILLAIVVSMVVRWVGTKKEGVEIAG